MITNRLTPLFAFIFLINCSCGRIRVTMESRNQVSCGRLPTPDWSRSKHDIVKANVATRSVMSLDCVESVGGKETTG
jgi:hypothetical protein